MAGLFLRGLCLVLFCYAVLGRGFAYLGVPPIYAGEAVLTLGLVVLLVDARVRRMLPSWSRTNWLFIFLLCGWGLLRTIPYIGAYGLDALRDGVLWGYASFSLLVFAVLKAYPANLWRVVRWYRLFASVYPSLILVLLVAVAAGVSFPELSLTGVPLIVLKPGDIGVHLGGITVFWLSGLAGRRSLLWASVVVTSLLIVGAMSRGAALAFATPVATYVVVTRRLPRRIRSLLLAGGLAVLVLLVLNPRVEVRPGRWLAPQQVVLNMVSIFSGPGDGSEELEGTKAWRLAWWGTIAQYTFGGDKFWTGKGFGVDLAEEDGFVLGGIRPNRHPHSVHMNMLARAGVPGLLLWLGVLLLWGRRVLRCYVDSVSSKRREWAALFLFLLGYWASFVVNASFDVFLEGPMGGIWFWSLMGMGLAATELYRRPSLWGRLSAPTLAWLPQESHPQASGLGRGSPR